MFHSQQTISIDIPPFIGSDHWPISLSWEITLNTRPNPFQFENFWMKNLDFLQNIELWWQERKKLYGMKMYQVQQKLKYVRMRINKWNKEFFGNIF
jgi:hypothetical protein